MVLLRQHIISQGKAAELLQLSRWDLSELMGTV
jgi:predicted HTH domain antitoxin